jgi:uncharacterized membrane protein YhaH (DUF805 family)
MFFLAGLSAATLAPLFNDPLVTYGGIVLAIVVMAGTAAARLRDMGCSAWFTPLAVIPLVAFYAGITAGDHQYNQSTSVELHMLTTTFFSAVISLSWLASFVVR